MALIEHINVDGTVYDLPSGGGGGSYTAGEGIDITGGVISADTDEQNKVIASALVELHNDKADKNQLNNYQLKGDYPSMTQVNAAISSAVAECRSEEEAVSVEKVDASALTDLNARIAALEARLNNYNGKDMPIEAQYPGNSMSG